MLQKTPGGAATVLARGAGERGRGEQRQATTMWGLLVWAYKRELVRAAEVRGGGGPALGGSNTSAVCRVLRTGIVGSGPVARITSMPVHADAEWVHGLVKTLDRDEFWLIVKSAESGDPPQWDPMIEPFRIGPMLKANGRPRMFVCPVERRPTACLLSVAGVPIHEAEAIRSGARRRYAQWHTLLAVMRDKILSEGDSLTRWYVTGIGAEAEPWERIVASGC